MIGCGWKMNQPYLLSNLRIWLYDMRIGSCEVEVFKKLWQIHIPPKVSFLLWRILLDRIPTKKTNTTARSWACVRFFQCECARYILLVFQLLGISWYLEKVVQFFRNPIRLRFIPCLLDCYVLMGLYLALCGCMLV